MFQWEVSQKFSLKLYFEIIIEGCSENSGNIFVEHQWMPLNE